jgi:transposase
VKSVPAPRLVGIEPNPGPGDVGNRIPEEQRWRVVFKKKDSKLTPPQIARELKMNKNTVNNILDKYEKTRTVHDRPKSGRKRKLSKAEVSRAVKKAKKGKTAPQIARELKNKVNPRTIRRRLREAGLFYGRVIKEEKLTASHKKNRLQYSKDMKDFQWKRVLFSDEKTFELGSGPTHMWQEHGDREVMEYVKHAPKLHAWGGIGYYMKTELYFFQENLTSELYQSILKDHLSESKLIYASKAPKKLPENWNFLQDNATTHKAKKSMEVVRELVGDRLISHPAKSPDLNPIEDMWSYLDRKVRAARITSIRTLKRFLKKEWKSLPWSEIRKSVGSMPRRLKSCIERRGSRTPY